MATKPGPKIFATMDIFQTDLNQSFNNGYLSFSLIHFFSLFHKNFAFCFDVSVHLTFSKIILLYTKNNSQKSIVYIKKTQSKKKVVWE